VAVNERTGHVFVACPARKLVWVLTESDLTILEGMATQGEIGILEEREGGLALVIDAQAVSWTPVNLTSYGVTTSLGKEGIAVDPVTNRVFIGDPEGDKLVVLQDMVSPTAVSVVGVVPVGDNPQGVDVNPDLHKAYVGNAGSNTVTVLNTITPTQVIVTINLTP
jgi:DNA-binding beta-propeller fold protein YncE